MFDRTHAVAGQRDNDNNGHTLINERTESGTKEDLRSSVVVVVPGQPASKISRGRSFVASCVVVGQRPVGRSVGRLPFFLRVFAVVAWL